MPDKPIDLDAMDWHEELATLKARIESLEKLIEAKDEALRKIATAYYQTDAPIGAIAQAALDLTEAKQ